jgi:hypothetical protein
MVDGSAPLRHSVLMSEEQQESPPTDPKEQMKAALDAKKAAHHMNAAGAEGRGKASGPQAQHAGKRQFRRKAGG